MRAPVGSCDVRRAVQQAMPWLPWAALGTIGILDALNVVKPIPDPFNLYLVGAAITCTVSTLVCRRVHATRSELAADVAEAAGQAPVSEAMLRGYQLAAQHCTEHGQDGDNGRPEEATTVPIPGLRLVHHPLSGTMYGNGQRPRDSGPGRHHLPRRRLHH